MIHFLRWLPLFRDKVVAVHTTPDTEDAHAGITILTRRGRVFKLEDFKGAEWVELKLPRL